MIAKGPITGPFYPGHGLELAGALAGLEARGVERREDVAELAEGLRELDAALDALAHLLEHGLELRLALALGEQVERLEQRQAEESQREQKELLRVTLSSIGDAVIATDTEGRVSEKWILFSAQPAKFDAELSYISGGMSWSADYNIVAPETGDTLELVGWVTLDNQSGKQFDHARVRLMAGDVQLEVLSTWRSPRCCTGRTPRDQRK